MIWRDVDGNVGKYVTKRSTNCKYHAKLKQGLIKIYQFDLYGLTVQKSDKLDQ